MKDYAKIKNKLLKNKEFRKAYDALEPEFALVQAIIEKRMEMGFTQAELAKRIGTKQSAVARLESGAYNPTVGFLEKVAKALDAQLTVSIF